MMMKNSNKTLGIYVHIPFCRSKCPYCDFFSLLNKDKQRIYVDSVVSEMEKRGKKNACKVDTLYIGGGTPSCIGGKEIARIVNAVKKSFNCVLSEVTIECNPSDANQELFKYLAECGVNRVSFGMQSAVDSERRILGRISGKEQVKKAVGLARNSGITNISLDIMLGVPNQTEHSLLESINFCKEMGVQHISAYMLRLEDGTHYFNNKEKFNFPSDDETAELYLMLVSELKKRGYEQYEISNFSKIGYESKHNLKYWRLEDYLGIGSAAHSFVDGKRFYYPRDIDYFINGGEPKNEGVGGDIQEKIMLGLRLKEGIDTALLSEPALKNIPLLEENGFCNLINNRIVLTPKGFLMSNTIINMLTE